MPFSSTAFKILLENALSESNRKDVVFEMNGFGEDVAKSPFNNKLPEERSYNRTVVIDVLAGQ